MILISIGYSIINFSNILQSITKWEICSIGILKSLRDNKQRLIWDSQFSHVTPIRDYIYTYAHAYNNNQLIIGTAAAAAVATGCASALGNELAVLTYIPRAGG